MKKVIAVLLVLVLYVGGAFAGEKARDSHFIAYDNGTVLDTKTKLMWAAKDNGRNITWLDARVYCVNYSGGGYRDWRMPTQDELSGLYDTAKAYRSDCGSYDLYLTKLIRLTCNASWSSETHGSDASGFIFSIGVRSWFPQSIDYDLRVLPVRSAK